MSDCECDAGVLHDQTYGESIDPGIEWAPVQRCDLCRRFDSDESAAYSLRETHDVIFAIAAEANGQGDWFVCRKVSGQVGCASVEDDPPETRFSDLGWTWWTENHADTLRSLIEHYQEQQCRGSAIHARSVLKGEERPDSFLVADVKHWEEA